MRVDANWMVRADGRILEHLSEEGPHAPTGIASDSRIGFDSELIETRLRDYLVPAGLAEAAGNGIFVATPKGRAYLAGEQDVRELPDPREE